MKNNNPFKMIGSYIGSIIAFIYTPLYRSGNFYTSNLDLFKESIKELVRGWIQISDNFLFLMVSAFFVPLTGFLIGWGIHSLIRRLRK